MTKPLLELTSPDSNFSVTVGRSSPTFIYGVRNLPDGQGGYPAFIFDTQALTTDRETGEVIVDTSYQYSYGGDDGRDLTSRSHEIPIGRFGFTRVDLTLTKDEEEDSDEAIYTREFEIAENFRRVTGETDFSASLGTESLGTITPGRDLRIGQNVNLRVWGLKVLVRVDGLTSGQYGWECSVASVPMITPRNITGSWTKRVSPSRASGGDTSSGYNSGYNESSYGGYDSGEMIHVGDEVSSLSERIRLLEDEQLVSNFSGSLEENRLRLIKKFRDGVEETIDLGEISGGGGSGVVRVEKGSDGKLTVVYSEGPDDVYEADISDVSLDGNELVIKKGEEEFKRIPLPSGGGGGGGITEDHLLTAINHLSKQSHPTAFGQFTGGIGQRNGEATPAFPRNRSDDFEIPIRGYSGFPGSVPQMIKAAPYSIVALIRAWKGSVNSKEDKMDPDNTAFFMVKMEKVLESDRVAYYSPKRYGSSGVGESVGGPADWWSTNALARIAPHDQEENTSNPKRMRIVGADDEPWTGGISLTIIPTSVYPDDRTGFYPNPRDFLNEVASWLFP